MKIRDITRPISASTAVWPGDQKPSLEWTARMEEGSSVNVGAIHLSTHTGTHLDAPLHYQADGAPVEAYPLDVFVGDALLIDRRECAAIAPSDIANVPPGTARLLVRTRQSDLGDDVWTDRITYFLPETIAELAARGVRLIGIDSPSFDPVDSTSLPAHQQLAKHSIANIENLQLAGIAEGTYHLVALPMNLTGMDAAPVRAILIGAA